MERRKGNCYVNNAYNGYYGNYDDGDDLSSFEYSDDDTKEEFFGIENETFVDEENERYYKNQSRCCVTPHKKSVREKSVDSCKEKLLFSREPNCSSTSREYFDYSNGISQPFYNISPTTSTPKKITAAAIPRTRHVSTTMVDRNNENRQTNNVCRKRSTSAPARKSFSVRNVNVTQPSNTQLKRSKSSLSIPSAKFKASIAAGPPNNNFIVGNTGRYYENCAIRNTRVYDGNTSISSVRPLISEIKRGHSQRNTAVISPIYAAKKATLSAFEIDTPRYMRSNCTQTSRQSMSPSKNSWLQIPSQSVPMCTLRTSALILLLSGTIGCLLSFNIMSKRGKSYELNFSMMSSFVFLCLGLQCFRFQQWQWLPNRNYVSGYVVLSLFSILQTLALWFLDAYPTINYEIVEITKGALCGISSLSLSLTLLGICSSCCCKYPPPDNRVSHAVRGFAV